MQVYTNIGIKQRLFISIPIGIIAGILGGFMRLGFEMLFPIMLYESPKALQITDSMIFAKDFFTTHYVFYNGYEWNLFYLAWHLCFSLFFALCYSVMAELFVKLKFGYGILYGLCVWVLIYCIILPLYVFIENTDIFYYLASFFECLLWIWIVELIRKELRSYYTKERDPF